MVEHCIYLPQQATEAEYFCSYVNKPDKTIHSLEVAHRKCNRQTLLCFLDMCDCTFQLTTQGLIKIVKRQTQTATGIKTSLLKAQARTYTHTYTHLLEE